MDFLAIRASAREDSRVQADAAAAIEAGEYARAVKTLRRAVFPLYRADDLDGLVEVERLAGLVVVSATGRVRRRAEDVAAEAACYRRGLEGNRELANQRALARWPSAGSCACSSP